MDSFFLLRFPREKKPTGPGFLPAGEARSRPVFRRHEILYKGRRDGLYGFAVSLYSSLYVVVKYMKLYEMEWDAPYARLSRIRMGIERDARITTTWNAGFLPGANADEELALLTLA